MENKKISTNDYIEKMIQKPIDENLSFDELQKYFENEEIDFLVCFVSSKTCSRCKVFMQQLFIPTQKTFKEYNHIYFCKIDCNIIPDDCDWFPFDQIKAFPSIILFERKKDSESWIKNEKLDFISNHWNVEFVCKPEENIATTFLEKCKKYFVLKPAKRISEELQIQETMLKPDQDEKEINLESKKLKLNQRLRLIPIPPKFKDFVENKLWLFLENKKFEAPLMTYDIDNRLNLSWTKTIFLILHSDDNPFIFFQNENEVLEFPLENTTIFLEHLQNVLEKHQFYRIKPNKV